MLVHALLSKSSKAGAVIKDPACIIRRIHLTTVLLCLCSFST
jgi:hypothetical protein